MLAGDINVQDTDRVEQAKKLAAGPLGEVLSKFPLLFAKVAFFGERPTTSQPARINNGTISLVELGNGPLGLTCHHVLKEYRKVRDTTPGVIFQIGNVELDPVEQLIDENQRLDLATIRLTDNQVAAITSEEELGSCVFQPRSWPPPLPTPGEYVAFGGYPGSLRTVVSFAQLDFFSWSSGASLVSSGSDWQFVSAFQREYWVTSFAAKHQLDLRDLGGMSGGPAFINRGLYWDLVGLVSEYHEHYDAMFFASLRAVRADGTIESPPV